MTIRLRLRLDGRDHDVEMAQDDGAWSATVDGTTFPLRWDRDGTRAVVSAGDAVLEVDVTDPRVARIDGRDTPFRILALHGVEGAPEDAQGGLGPMKPPMTGRLESLRVEEGQKVSKGDVLFVLEAMKMHNEVKAPADAVVTALHAGQGDAVDTGTVVLELGPLDA